MESIQVVSSNIQSIGYDEEKQELHITFNSGSTYIYSGVPVETYNEFLGAHSKGRYLNENIKGQYDSSKV